MNSYFKSFGAGAVVIASAVLSVCADELLTNGGFEDATPTTPNKYCSRADGANVTGWTLYDKSGISRANNTTWVPSYPSGSSVAVYLQQTAAIAQTVNVPSAGRYRLTFDYVARGYGYRDHQVVVTIGGQEVWSKRILNYAAWNTAVVVVDLEAGEQELRFTGSKPSDAATSDTCSALDNVSLVPHTITTVRVVAHESDRTGDWATAYTNIQEAIAAGGIYSVIRLRNGHYDVTNTLELTAANQTLSGESRAGVILDGGGTNRIFRSNGKASPTLEHITFTGGYLSSPSADGYGAAVYMEQGSGAYLVSDCAFTNNVLSGLRARGGGFASYGNVGGLVTNCYFAGNTQTGAGNGTGGGAGYFDNQASSSDTIYSTIADCTFTNNYVLGNGPRGAAVWTGGNTHIVGCRFSGNKCTTTGSGIYGPTILCGQYSQVRDCVFDWTDTSGYGTCLSMDKYAMASNCVFRNVEMNNAIVNMSTSSLLTDCVFTNNYGANALVGSIGQSDMSVRNCLFADNCLDNSKGYAFWGHTCKGITIENCTFAGNGAKFYAEGDYQYSTSCYANCIFQGFGPADNGKFRVVMTNSITPVAPGGVGSVGVIVTNSAVRSYARRDYRLPAGSPAVDGGAWRDWMSGKTDLNGDARVVGAAVDMGCFERQSGEVDPAYCTRAVATAADRTGAWADAHVGIQTAVDAAYDGEPLYVKAGTYALAAPVTVLNRDIDFIGEGADRTVLDGQGAGRCLVAIVSSTAGDLSFDGFTFANGTAGDDTSADNYNARGGVAYLSCNQSTRRIRMSNCRITGGRSLHPLDANGNILSASHFRGAGAYAVNYCTFDNCLFDDNIASNAYAGALGIESAGTAGVRDSGMYFSGCTFTNCHNLGKIGSQGSFCAGVYDFGSQPIWVENSTFADMDGGKYTMALKTGNGTVVTNCLFKDIVAAYELIAAGNSSSRVVDCVFERNSGTGFLTTGPAYEGCTMRNNSGHVWFTTIPATVRNCLFYGNKAHVLWIFNQSNKSGTFENCTFADNVGSSASIIDFGNYATTDNRFAFVNCVLWGNTADVSSSNNRDTYQIAYTNCLVKAYTTVVPVTSEKCVVDKDPLFCDAASGDYRLKRRSPARDEGVTRTWMTAEAVDKAGNPRRLDIRARATDDALPDIGAYECDQAKTGVAILAK